MGYPHYSVDCHEHWRHVTNANIIDAAHIERQREFSLRTFGPGPRTAGVLDHIAKELDEIRKAPTDLSEWADIIILALDGAHRTGAEPQDIIDAIVAKQTKNEARDWPDWRTQDPDKAIEHHRGPLEVETGHDIGLTAACEMFPQHRGAAR